MLIRTALACGLLYAATVAARKARRRKYLAAPTINPSSGGSLIAETLQRHGVKHIFTLCGGHISPILISCKKIGIRVVDVRHEANAAFAADAIARITGTVGVVAVTAGPGLTNTLTAVKNAQLAQSPLLVLAGAAPTVLRGKGALQDIDQFCVLAPHCKAFYTCNRVAQIVPFLQEAIQTAQSGVPGPVCLEFPTDVLYPKELVEQFFLDPKRPPKTLIEKLFRMYLKFNISRIFSGSETQKIGIPMPFTFPSASDGQVSKLISILKKSQRPVILIGSQAVLQSADDVAAAVRKLGVPVYLSGMGRGLLGRNDKLQLRHKRREAFKEADVVILVGVPIDFRLEYGMGVPRKVKLVSINRCVADTKGGVRSSDVALIADPAQLLINLGRRASEVDKSKWTTWLDALHRRDDEREAQIEKEATEVPTIGLNPIAVCKAVEEAMSSDAILVADGGDFVGTAAYVLRPRAPLAWLDPGAFGTLGVGGGFAVGAAAANPNREIWLIWGDGSAGYSLAEYDTCTRHKLPIISIIGNDACWSQIYRDQVDILKDDVGCMLAHTDYHLVAEGYGGKGILVKQASELKPALQEAKRLWKEGHSVCINVIIGKSDFRKGSLSM